jgi:hypothetical protein
MEYLKYKLEFSKSINGRIIKLRVVSDSEKYLNFHFSKALKCENTIKDSVILTGYSKRLF